MFAAEQEAPFVQLPSVAEFRAAKWSGSVRRRESAVPGTQLLGTKWKKYFAVVIASCLFFFKCGEVSAATFLPQPSVWTAVRQVSLQAKAGVSSLKIDSPQYYIYALNVESERTAKTFRSLRLLLDTRSWAQAFVQRDGLKALVSPLSAILGVNKSVLHFVFACQIENWCEVLFSLFRNGKDMARIIPATPIQQLKWPCETDCDIGLCPGGDHPVFGRSIGQRYPTSRSTSATPAAFAFCRVWSRES